jgi:hypothetical protein
MVSSIQHFPGRSPYQAYNDPVTTTRDEESRKSSPGAMPEDHVSLSERAKEASSGIKNESELNEEEKKQVNQLKKRDAEVKAHEQAHMAAGSGVVQGGANYQYEKGPDGRQYAVGGEVKIDLSTKNTPEATISKMQQVRKAALAPAQPSGTDRAVAAQASQVEVQARMERHSGDRNEPGKSGKTTESDTSGPAASGRSNSIDESGPGQPEGTLSIQTKSSAGRRIDIMA